MKRHPDAKTTQWFLLADNKKELDLRPNYQRGLVWSSKQKRMLVDTILKDMDIPKIYLRELSGDKHEVVDGQQRIQTIIDFCNGKFKTEPTDIGDKKIGALSYGDLGTDLQVHFNNYLFSVVILRNTTEEEVKEMFIRLQSGTSLNAQEKRNAKTGKMCGFINELAKHKFFPKCGFKDHRAAYQQIVSQMTMLEIAGGMHNIKNSDLDTMYDEYKDAGVSSTVTAEINKTLSHLDKIFTEPEPELGKHSTISMFLLIRHLRKHYVIAGREKEIFQWFVDFEKFRKEDNKKPTDERTDNELIEYQVKTGNTTDAVDSLEFRQKVLRVRLLTAIPDMALLDSQRIFTYEQRLAIWRRDKGICQIADKCGGVKLEWDDNWHADHKIPFSQSGKTSFENGQVACAECNLAKGARVNN